jgi:hypothetical protein
MSDATSSATAATQTCTLPGMSGQYTYLDGFEISVGVGALPGGAELTLSGVVNGPWTYQVAAPAASGFFQSVTFPKPRRSSDVSTDITLTLPSLGLTTGKASIVMHGE